MEKPEIRFKGYTDEWEQRKLGDSCKLNGRIGFRGYTEKDIISKEAGGVLTFSPTNIVDNKLTIECKNTYITREKYDESPEIKISNGDILFVKTGSTLGKSALVTGLKEDASINPQIVVMRVEKDTENFMSNVLITDRVMKQVAAVKIGGAVPTMTETELKNFTYFAPAEKEEKKKIGDYFRTLDHLITLHQRKCDEVKTLKKYMLQKMFPQNEQKVPEIRFEGFTEAWEQRKLGDWGNFYYGRSCPKWSVTEDATIPCIRYGELYTKFGAKIDRVYSYTNMPPENLRFSKGTEVLIPRVGEDPMDYNHCTWLSMQDVAIGEMISVFNTDNNPLFTATMFNATLQNEFAMRVEGGSVTNLYFEKLKNIDVSFPSIPEQEKIAAYFENFDHLITLHQRKCDEVKTLKKYMLQKMFPQNEQKVPQIRFEGFTEAWEQRKLGDLVDRVTRKNQDLVSELPLTISAQYGLIDQNEFFDKRVASKDVSGYYLIENGEFAYNKSTSTDAPWGAIKRLDRYENGVLSTLYIIFGIKENNPVDSDFLVSYYSTNLWHKGIHEIAAEGARNHGLLNIAPADFFETKLMIPQDIEEQKKIGKYFEELERLITLHQQKCEELKKIKKFMLQKMFVQEKR